MKHIKAMGHGLLAIGFIGSIVAAIAGLVYLIIYLITHGAMWPVIATGILAVAYAIGRSIMKDANIWE